MKLRFLHLEDNPSDAELIQLRLTREWPECQVFAVTNEADFREALGKGGFDLILADYSLPSFTGLQALSLARQGCPEIPFIFLSGMIGEEVAVEALKTGAADYVLKDRLSRLVPVIRRALQEAEDRAQRKLAEEKLRSSEEQDRDLFENATDLIQSNGPDGRFLYVNRAWRQTLGYSESEAERMSIMDIVHPEYHSECRRRFQPAGRGGESGIFEAIFLTKYCCHVYVEGGVSYRLEAGKPVATWGIFRDVTQKRLAEVALKRTMREYEDLVNAIDGIVWKAEIPGLRFTFVSLQAERLLGYPPRSWLEEPEFWQNHIHPEDRDRAVGLYTQAASENEPRSFEYRMVAADGRLVWLRDIVSARTGEGAAPQIQGIMVNITPRKQAEAARRESDALKGAIMEAALDCIVVMDEEGKIIEFNPAAEKTFGYCRTEVIGRDVAGKLIPAILRDRADRNPAKHDTAGKRPIFGKRIEVTAVRGDGSEFPVEMAIIPIREGDQSVSTAYVRDITERKAAEERVNRIQAKLELTNRDLLRKNEEIQNFYHTLSHELKTPLTSGREFISIVMDGLAGPLNETQMEYLGIAKESCNQLRVCIDDLLDATRLETGKLAIEIKPTCLSTVMERVVTTLTPQATEKGVDLNLEAVPNLSAIPLDEHRITQVITNLLNNAIKNTPAGGNIVISAKDAPGRPELVEVSVCDTGCGIPAKEHSRIFDRLHQVKTGDATTEQGVGLGLYLCRELVQLHGGNIRVESAPGKGSTFAFILPKTQKLLRSNVLVIHGDPDARDGLKRLLEQEGFNVYAAAGRADTMEIMQRQVPDLVLLDLATPNADGHATLEEIRNKWGTVPVIVHAGEEDGDLVKEALAFSPFTLLAKPCSAAQLVETVRKVQRGGDTAIWKKNHFDLERPRGKKARNTARGIKRDIKPKSPRRLKL